MRKQLSWVLLGFLFVVALTGGGSREDIESLSFLRFLSAVTIAFSVLLVGRHELSRVRIPLALLGFIAAVALLQLVPLAPSLWSSLPGHGNIARIDTLLELDAWRPLTLSPRATINTLGSLTVPMAALLLFSMVNDRNLVLGGIVAIGLASALFGILQLFADPRSGLFLYEITNNGSAVGFFANRNHHAVFLACCALIALFLMSHGDSERFKWMRPTMAGSVLVLALAVVTNASRAGLISFVLVLLFGAFGARFARPREKVQSEKKRHTRYLALALSAASALLLAVFVAAERSPALARILDNNALEDLRAKLLPILVDMAVNYQPWGTGFGAFEHAYRMREPVDLLQPAYVNEAHNDWLQFPIEAGVPGISLLAVGGLYVIARSIRLFRRPAESATPLLGLALIVILGAASVVDYPLRVPFMMTLAVIALAMFAAPAVERKTPDGPV